MLSISTHLGSSVICQSLWGGYIYSLVLKNVRPWWYVVYAYVFSPAIVSVIPRCSILWSQHTLPLINSHASGWPCKGLGSSESSFVALNMLVDYRPNEHFDACQSACRDSQVRVDSHLPGKMGSRHRVRDGSWIEPRINKTRTRSELNQNFVSSIIILYQGRSMHTLQNIKQCHSIRF